MRTGIVWIFIVGIIFLISIWEEGKIDNIITKNNSKTENADVLNNKTFQRVDYSNTDLRGIHLPFSQDLKGANFANADLCRNNLRERNFSGSNFTNANMFEIDLAQSNLSNANLTEALLCAADLRFANLYQSNLTKANLRNANLNRANMEGAVLTDALLFDTNLKVTNLRNANLRNANLRGADLRGADLRGANLDNANLAYIEFDDSTRFDDYILKSKRIRYIQYNIVYNVTKNIVWDGDDFKGTFEEWSSYRIKSFYENDNIKKEVEEIMSDFKARANTYKVKVDASERKIFK